MCGIVGGCGAGPEGLDRAVRAIAHRGPDALGTWTSGPLAGSQRRLSLGHTRLAIVDLDPRSNQPFVCPETGNVLVFNGEIYNFQELRAELQVRGRTFRTTSDTEVVLAAYDEWGAAAAARFNGMWALALYDPRAQRLWLSRDRAGKKPLYWTAHRGELAFASELPALLALRRDVPADIDVEALRDYVDLGYVPGVATLYRHVRKLPPSSSAVVDLAARTHRVLPEAYWRLPATGPHAANESHLVDELDALLTDAVRLRLISDVPVGAFLSGGLDSSLIAAIAGRLSPRLLAYTARFDDRRMDESPIAASVARHVGLEHRIIDVPHGTAGDLERLAGIFGEPFGDSSVLPMYAVSRGLREMVKVALSGDGGDELFAGYDSYAAGLQEEGVARWPIGARRLASAAATILPTGMPGKNFLRRLPYDGVDRFLFQTSRQEPDAPSVFRPDVERTLAALPRDAVRRQVARDVSPESDTLIQAMTRIDFLTYLPDDILAKVDRATMAVALEARAPLLDYRIVEFAYRLPDDQRLGHGIRKRILKQVARRYLPADFPYERKQGFSIPERDWFLGPWATLAEQVCPKDARLIDPARLPALRRAHARSGRLNRAMFKMLMLAYWERGTPP